MYFKPGLFVGANCRVPLIQNVDKLITSSFKNKTGAGSYLSLNAIFILQERGGLPLVKSTKKKVVGRLEGAVQN